MLDCNRKHHQPNKGIKAAQFCSQSKHTGVMDFLLGWDARKSAQNIFNTNYCRLPTVVQVQEQMLVFSLNKVNSRLWLFQKQKRKAYFPQKALIPRILPLSNSPQKNSRKAWFGRPHLCITMVDFVPHTSNVACLILVIGRDHLA